MIHSHIKPEVGKRYYVTRVLEDLEPVWIQICAIIGGLESAKGEVWRAVETLDMDTGELRNDVWVTAQVAK